MVAGVGTSADAHELVHQSAKVCKAVISSIIFSNEHPITALGQALRNSEDIVNEISHVHRKLFCSMPAGWTGDDAA
jgi:hypothetical protein